MVVVKLVGDVQSVVALVLVKNSMGAYMKLLRLWFDF